MNNPNLSKFCIKFLLCLPFLLLAFIFTMITSISYNCSGFIYNIIIGDLKKTAKGTFVEQYFNDLDDNFNW